MKRLKYPIFVEKEQKGEWSFALRHHSSKETWYPELIIWIGLWKWTIHTHIHYYTLSEVIRVIKEKYKQVYKEVLGGER